MIVVRALALIAGLVSTAGAQAQDYPARPVTIVVPTGPGGGMKWSRLLARRAAAAARSSSRTGRGGLRIGAAAVPVRRPTAAHTLMATSSTMAINASICKNLPFDPLKDLMPVIRARAVQCWWSICIAGATATSSMARKTRPELRYLGHRHGVAPVRRVVQDANRR